MLMLVGMLTTPLGLGAAVILSDSFDYPNGSLITVSSGTWVHHSGSVDGQVQVSGGRGLLTGNDSEDVNAGFTPAGDTLYAGLTIRFTALPSSEGNYFCHFKSSGSTYRPKIYASTSGAPGGEFRLGISNGANSPPNQVLPMALQLNTDYRLVFRYTVSSPSGTLWVNPASEADPSVTALDTASSATMVAFALRQSGGIGALEVDDLIVATTFNEVVTEAPPQAPVILTQPQDQNVVEGASALFTVGASGDTPLTYQWQFNGGPLAGATNASLSLANVTPSNAGIYQVIASNPLGMAASDGATLSVATAVDSLSVFNYNVKGNNAADWSTNSAQIQAIGRQLQYLDPDIITFQEIPLDQTYEMTNFVAAFRPGFHLADNSGTDGFIRSVILSRYPINRSQSWLDGVSLNAFGYNGRFTRDLFEAEIAVPGFPEPLHVFTTHLKARSDDTSSSRRAAEANAISNFFVTGFLTTNASRPYILTGDLNEDIDNPPSSNPQTIERLIGTSTGLQLTTPVNPITGSRNTLSIQGTLNVRFDYILPSGVLFSNILGSQVFRTDVLPGPPPPLFSGDSVTASDHLPVVMEFSNPFELPFQLLSIARSNATVFITWESTPGRLYDVEGATPLGPWSVVASNLTTSGSTLTHPLPATNALQFFRVRRQ
jgi:endonuclease/exonuclease/phosphatase family metal-dependent hydrolase